MKIARSLSAFSAVAAALALIFVPAIAAQTSAPQGAGRGPAPKPFAMSIAAFADGTDIPPQFTQAGNQTSPAITWANAPANTVTFLLHMHDLDFSHNQTTDDQLHWLVWNIPASATGLAEGLPQGATLPNGAFQISVSGQVYRGPGAPATGPKHHYTFELYALDTKVDVQPGTDAFDTRTNVMKAIQGHVLAKTAYMGLFHRP
jgi:Raf kinase inhibitor-like YbhB/YbcL family protein